jgi:hypothetical protein
MNRLLTELCTDKLLALQLALLVAVSLLLRLPGTIIQLQRMPGTGAYKKG